MSTYKIEEERTPTRDTHSWDPPPPDFLDPVVEAYKKDVDRTLLRENLKLTVAERCQKFARNMRMVYELRRAGQRLRESQGLQS